MRVPVFDCGAGRGGDECISCRCRESNPSQLDRMCTQATERSFIDRPLPYLRAVTFLGQLHFPVFHASRQDFQFTEMLVVIDT